MSQEYNFKHVRTNCPECKSDNIIVDSFHQETYCTKCGLILKDNTIFKITQILQKEQDRNHWLNQFWKTTNKKIKFKEMRDIYK